MVTADNITDDQIRTLRQHTGVETRDARAITSLCDLALGAAETAINEDGEPCDPDENEIDDARARCAAILNRNIMDGGTGWPPDDRTPAQVDADATKGDR